MHSTDDDAPSKLAPTVAAMAGVLGAMIPYAIARRRRAQRLDRFEENFPEAIDLLTRAIRAGHPLSAGMAMVADEAPEPISTEFHETFEQQRFGLPFEDALLGLTDRVDLVEGMTDMWFNLALKQRMGRRIAFKLLT